AGLQQSRQPPSSTVGGQLAARRQPKTNPHTTNPAQPVTNPPAATQPHRQPNSPSKLASNKADSHLHPLWEGSLLREDNLTPTPTPQLRRNQSPNHQRPPSRPDSTIRRASWPPTKQTATFIHCGRAACCAKTT